MKLFSHLIFFIGGLSLFAQPALKEILDSPFASDLTVSKDGKTIAWVDNIAGERNIFFAKGLKFALVSQLTNFTGDQGIALSNLKFTPDGENLIFVRGNSKNKQGEAANPAFLNQDTQQTIFIQSLNKGREHKISQGSQPSISHDGLILAFINNKQLWTVSLSDSIYKPKKLLGF